MTEFGKEHMSKAEIVECLRGAGLYANPVLEGTRLATIVDGEKFYNKIISIYPNTFTKCKNGIDVTIAANNGPAIDDIVNVDEWGIEREEE